MKILQLVAFIALALCFSSANPLHAQGWSSKNLDEMSRWEVGIAGGGTLYFGDLTPTKRDYFSETTPYGGLLVRYYLGQNFSVRANLCVAQLAGNDTWYSTRDWREHRNFSFTTALGEVSAMLEYDVLRTNRDETGNKWGLYAFAGLGLCYTHPNRSFSKLDRTYFDNSDKAVSGLDADQNSSPSHVALVVPVGLGIRYEATRRISLFVEGSVRQGFDDQIDGFSNSVSSNKSDAYSFFSLGVNLRFKRRGWWM